MLGCCSGKFLYIRRLDWHKTKFHDDKKLITTWVATMLRVCGGRRAGSTHRHDAAEYGLSS